MDLLNVLMADGTKDNLYLLHVVLVEIDISLIPEGRYLKQGYKLKDDYYPRAIIIEIWYSFGGQTIPV